MKREDFKHCMQENSVKLEDIRIMAHKIHREVNQTYDGNKPYGVHLDMVARGVRDYGHLVIARDEDVLPVFFGAWFHDSIEDARLTYRDVLQVAQSLNLDDNQALMAAEIVYALTNEKGRTRQERANEQYYSGIRRTPYAPLVKMCDRLANLRYSASGQGAVNNRMSDIYRDEMLHFIQSITVDSDDCRFMVPTEMVDEVWRIIADMGEQQH